MDAQTEARQLRHVEDDLVRELELDPQVVHAAVERAVAALAAAPVRDFVPVLARRLVRSELCC